MSNTFESTSCVEAGMRYYEFLTRCAQHANIFWAFVDLRIQLVRKINDR